VSARPKLTGRRLHVASGPVPRSQPAPQEVTDLLASAGFPWHDRTLPHDSDDPARHVSRADRRWPAQRGVVAGLRQGDHPAGQLDRRPPPAINAVASNLLASNTLPSSSLARRCIASSAIRRLAAVSSAFWRSSASQADTATPRRQRHLGRRTARSPSSDRHHSHTHRRRGRSLCRAQVGCPWSRQSRRAARRPRGRSGQPCRDGGAGSSRRPSRGGSTIPPNPVREVAARRMHWRPMPAPRELTPRKRASCASGSARTPRRSNPMCRT
jgi:hypothetical protein